MIHVSKKKRANKSNIVYHVNTRETYRQSADMFRVY